MRAIILGEAVGRSTDPDRPLSGPSGRRLASLAGLPGYDQLAARYELRNLLRGYPGDRGRGAAFPTHEALVALDALLPELVGRVIVLLGSRLGQFWDVRPFEMACRNDALVAVIPHPSGLNLIYNDQEACNQARRVLLVAWRIADAGISLVDSV